MTSRHFRPMTLSIFMASIFWALAFIIEIFSFESTDITPVDTFLRTV